MCKLTEFLVLPMFIVFAASTAHAQPYNFLLNQSWQSKGDATIEKIEENNCFVVRNGGSFHQEVALPGDAAGQFIVFLGQGSSERIHSDKSITDLPYLYGHILDTGIKRNERILSYLQGMLGRSSGTKDWVTMSGIFKVPENASRVRFFLNQASARGMEHDGSAARFFDVGMYLFPTEEGAKLFVEDIRRSR